MAVITEQRLSADLKAGKLQRVYFLYGEEQFLTKTYEKRITAAALGDGDADMNYSRFTQPPTADALSDLAESMPFFADYKCIVLADLDADKLDTAELNGYIKIIESLPDTTVLVISQTGIEIDGKKPKAKMKKLMAAAEKQGSVCEFAFMEMDTIVRLMMKKAERSGCNLSHDNAVLLADMCGRNMSFLQNEVQKLCDYTVSGEITREAIEALVPRLVDSSVYSLTNELMAGRVNSAFKILDDLFEQRVDTVIIMATLSGHFVDCYRAKLGQLSKRSASAVAAAFNYPKNRTFLVSKAFNTVKPLSVGYLKSCVDILYRTNLLLNSSKADKRTLIEQAITEISVLKRN